MKLKITFSLLLLVFAFSGKGQSLAGTSWDTYSPGTPPSYQFTMHFTSDSVEIVQTPPIANFIISSYSLSGSTITITDKPGASNCGTVPVQYTITIINDTLNFDNVNDTCSGRLDVLENHIFVRTGLNISELALQKTVKIYPNPASEFIKLDFYEFFAGLNYTFTNAFGQIIFENAIDTTNQTLDISTFPAGMYFLSIEGFSTSGMKFMKY